MNAEMTLDEAWAAAEAALPEGWRVGRLVNQEGAWVAEARKRAPGGYTSTRAAQARTPTAALLALAARLQEQPR